MTRVTDGNGNVTTYTFTPWNQPASTVESSVTGQTALADRTYTTTYDGGGLPVRDVQPGGITVDRVFDELGRLTSESGAGGGTGAATRTFGYDLAGRRTSISDPAGTVTFAYDDWGLVLASSLPGSATAAAAFDYDDAGRMNLRSDGAGESTFTYTARGELDHVTDPLTGAVTDYDFNDAGQVSTVRYGGATPATRGFTYDGQGRLDVDTLTPTAGSALVYDYGYDPDGNLTSQDVAAAGNPAAGTNSYTYDRSGRLDTWTGPAGEVTDYGHDPAGNRTTAGSTAYTYDARNRLTGATNPAGSTVNTWTPRGTMATSTLHPVQFRVGLVVGDPGALTAADNAIMNRLTAAGHTVALVDDTAPAVGAVELVVVAESVDELFVAAKYRGHGSGVLYLDPGLWDDDGMTSAPGAPLPNTTNTVVTPSHPAVAGKSGTIATTTTGDHAGVTDSVLGSGATKLLDRSGLGNVHVEVAFDVGANRALFGPAPGRRVALGWSSAAITSLTADGGAIFDATVRWAGGAPIQTVSAFDALGRQTGVGAATYAFDGLDRVTARDPDGAGPLASVGFAYAGGEIDPVGYGTESYARTPGGELAAIETPAGARLAVENRHGDLTALLDGAGAVTDTDVYDPYGTPVGQTGATDPSVGFQGDWTDPVSGQVWMGARWYQPGTATFTARDTVFGQLATPITLNRYTYANGDPLEYFDPEGERSKKVDKRQPSTSGRSENTPSPKPRRGKPAAPTATAAAKKSAKLTLNRTLAKQRSSADDEIRIPDDPTYSSAEINRVLGSLPDRTVNENPELEEYLNTAFNRASGQCRFGKKVCERFNQQYTERGGGQWRPEHPLRRMDWVVVAAGAPSRSDWEGVMDNYFPTEFDLPNIGPIEIGVGLVGRDSTTTYTVLGRYTNGTSTFFASAEGYENVYERGLQLSVEPAGATSDPSDYTLEGFSFYEPPVIKLQTRNPTLSYGDNPDPFLIYENIGYGP